MIFSVRVFDQKYFRLDLEKKISYYIFLHSIAMKVFVKRNQVIKILTCTRQAHARNRTPMDEKCYHCLSALLYSSREEICGATGLNSARYRALWS